MSVENLKPEVRRPASRWMQRLAMGMCILSLLNVPGLMAQTSGDDLKALIEKQQQVLDELKAKLAEQQTQLEALKKQQSAPAPAPEAKAAPAAAAAKKPEEKPAASALTVAGFKFSGDFRLRLDAIERAASYGVVQQNGTTAIVDPAHNVRGRYRLRLNVDKDISSMFNFHSQLATGPLNNQLSTNQDFSDLTFRDAISISEAYADFHPTKNISLRGGKIAEVFADSSKFMFDDDLRLTGTHARWKIPFNGQSSVEFLAGQYILTNPGVARSSSDWVTYGFPAGKQVRSAALFDQGMTFKYATKSNRASTLVMDMLVYKDPQQIAYASTSNGTTALLNAVQGVTVYKTLGGTGNALKSSGGPYLANRFQIAHLSYDFQTPLFKLGTHEMPFRFNAQLSRNVGYAKYRDAWMGTASIGKVAKLGDSRFLYAYAFKDVNSMISQFTDDDLGTNSGVNIKTHWIQYDLGLAKYLTWSNIFYIQDPIRGNTKTMYVPVPLGVATQYRFMTQIQFTF